MVKKACVRCDGSGIDPKTSSHDMMPACRLCKGKGFNKNPLRNFKIKTKNYDEADLLPEDFQNDVIDDVRKYHGVL